MHMDSKGHTGLLDNDYCFACGALNPLGLHLQFRLDDEWLEASFTPAPHLQGFAGVMHGGIAAVILDDLMNNLITRKCRRLAVTGKLEVRYRKPVPIGSSLVCRAKITAQRHGLYNAEAQILDCESREVLVEAASVQMVMRS